MTALGRSTSQPAALDSGRGPQLLTDEQLSQRIAGVGTRPSSPHADDHDALAEYADIVMESEARIRDRIATVAYAPPRWVVEAIGERPADPRSRRAWDRAVDQALRYRVGHRVHDEVDGLLGPPPPRRDGRLHTEWLACHGRLQRDLRLLRLAVDRQVEMIARQ